MSENKQPLVSVIIPVYNVEHYLGKCLDSIILNTYRNLEIICINDGSSDGSQNILFQYSQNDPRIVLINQENQGVAAARNNGLKKAHGDYIAFVDSDDYIHNQYFQTMVNCIQRKDADVVICEALKFRLGESVVEKRYKNIHYKRLNSRKFFRDYYARHMVWGRLYRRKLLDGHRFSSQVRMSDDTLFNLEVMRTAKNPVVYKADTPLYYYLQRDNSIVHSANYLRLKDISDYYLENLRNDDEADSWGWLLTMQAIKSMLSYRYMIRFRPDSKILKKDADKAIFIYLKKLIRCTEVSKFEVLKHGLMYCFPELYRRFRIHDDPTLLEWEKKEKVER